METKDVKIDTVSINDSEKCEPKNSADATCAEIAADKIVQENTDVAMDTAKSDPDACAAQIESLIAEARELNDKYLRMAAELENTRRRAAIDSESRARTRAMSVAEKFLPVMDAIIAAQKHAPDDAGIIAMARAMDAAFAEIGITKIESMGVVLNPQFHNAISVIDAPDDGNARPAPNTILEEMQAGYMFGDNVLRPAMVVVCK